jgi:predicted metal-dependent hydrolase
VPLGYFHALFAQYGYAVRRFRVAPGPAGSLELTLQKAPRYSEATLDEVKAKIRERLGAIEIAVHFEEPEAAPSLPRAPARVRLKVMSSQWGSLAPDGSMALDLALVLGRPSAFEYVLVHELCHLLQANHSPAFWHEVEARFPAWRAERDYFHAQGRRLKAQLRRLLN